jgi:transcriptional regulator with XRE-family HTH domain
MSFGQHLRALREEAGLSRAELARRAVVPVSTLCNWEGDRGFPGLAACLGLAAALGVPAERFAEGVEDPAGQDAAPGPTPTEKGRARRLSRAQEKPRERKARRPRGGEEGTPEMYGGRPWPGVDSSTHCRRGGPPEAGTIPGVCRREV